MVARERSWIPKVPTSSMVIALTLLFLLAGWPLQGISAEPAADSNVPTASECRRHVEKALDQYFDSNDKATIGDQETTKKVETPTPPSQLHPSSHLEEDDDDDDDDDNDPPVSVADNDKKEDADDDDEDEDDEDEDDDDEDEEEETSIDKEKTGISKGHGTDDSNADEEEDDDDDENDDDDDEDELEEDDDAETELVNKREKFATKQEIKEGVKTEDEDDDEDEDEDDEEDNDRDDDEKDGNEQEQEPKKTDDDDDDDDDVDDNDVEDEEEDEEQKVKETKETTSTDEDDDDDDDDDDEDDDEDDDDDEEQDEKNQQDEDDDEEDEKKGEKVEVRKEEEDEDEDEEDEEQMKEKKVDEEDDDDDEDDDDEEEEEEEKQEEEKESKISAPKENLTVTVTISKRETPEEIPSKIPDILAKYRRVPPTTTEQVASKEPKKEEQRVKDGREAVGDDDTEDEKDKTTSSLKAPLSAQKPISRKAEEESLKVTGPSDHVAPGMAQGFPRREPIPQQPKTQTFAQETAEAVKKTPLEGNVSESKPVHKVVVKDEAKHEDDDAVENIYEEDETDEGPSGLQFRNRNHIDAILGLDEVGTDYDHQEDKLAQTIFRDIKKIHATSIKPMEMLYKFTDSTTRLLGDAEIFGKPMILFLGPWNTGKTTIINYLLGTERTPSALKTGTGITDVDFTVINYGDQRQTISGTELAADWRYASLQKFGQGFLDHFRSVTMPHTLLKKIALVDTPGILESRKNTDRGYSFSDAFQWFIDRADAIYVVLDPNKVDIGAELGAVLDQLKGRDVRFVLNKADTIRRSDLMKVVGQLFWNLSPLMSGTEAPVIYAVSLSTKPFSPTAPAKFLSDQENNFLYDLKDTMDKKVENRILYARRHAVRVRNHAKMVDCYLATYYRTKSIFSSKRNVAKLITENPTEYQIYEGLSSMTNVSRYDLPDPATYKNFFKIHPLYDFKPLASTCSYFRGCPMDKLDNAIANELPELFTKYKKAKNDSPQPAAKQDGR